MNTKFEKLLNNKKYKWITFKLIGQPGVQKYFSLKTWMKWIFIKLRYKDSHRFKQKNRKQLYFFHVKTYLMHT